MSARQIEPGDVVVVGPGYRMAAFGLPARHEPDGWEGTYTVLEIRPTGDALLARGALACSEYLDAWNARDWDVAVNVGRCTYTGVVADDSPPESIEWTDCTADGDPS